MRRCLTGVFGRYYYKSQTQASVKQAYAHSTTDHAWCMASTMHWSTVAETVPDTGVREVRCYNGGADCTCVSRGVCVVQATRDEILASRLDMVCACIASLCRSQLFPWNGMSSDGAD